MLFLKMNEPQYALRPLQSGQAYFGLMISKGFPRQFVSKMLGRSKEQTTQIYYEMNSYHMAGGLSKFDDVVFLIRLNQGRC